MTSRYRRMAVLGTIGVALAMSQQACANDASETPAAPVTASPTQTTPTRSGNTSATATSEPRDSGSSGERGDPDEAGVPGASAGKPITVPGCLNGDVKVEVTFQPQAVRGKHRLGLVAVTNTSNHTCKVRGHFAMLLVNAADEPVDVPREDVDEPSKAVTVVVKPGRSAFAGIKWTVCDKAASDCGVGNSMRYNLQKSTDGRAAELIDFPTADNNALVMSSLQIGTLQPSSQGVVAW